MGTVRDFKNHVLEESGVSSVEQFVQLSEAHRAFLKKLNKLGAKNIESQPPESVPDIDVTVELSDEEWTQLETEFHQLQ